jgi:hypothetical protein
VGITELKTAPPLGEVRFNPTERIMSWIADIYLTTFAEEFKESTNRGRSRTNLAER